MGRLVDSHGEVVLGRDVVAAVAGPTQIERLALHRATGHGDELLDDAHLHGVLQKRIVHHRTVHHGKGQVPHVDGQPQPLGEVQAGLAAAQLGLVGDVVVNESRGMEMLDSRGGGGSAIGIAAHGQAGREADERAVALARVLTVMVERIVQVAIHIPMSPMGNVTVDQLPDRIGISFQIVFERDGRLFDAGEDF